MKLFKALDSDLVKLSNVLRDTISHYRDLIPAVITVTSDVDITAILATKSKSGPKFPGFNGVYSVKDKVSLKAGDKIIGAITSQSSLNNDPRRQDEKPDEPYFYFYSPEKDKWGIVYAADYKKLVSNSDIKSSLLTKIKQDKKDESKKKAEDARELRLAAFAELNAKYKSKFKFKYLKPQYLNNNNKLYYVFKVHGGSFNDTGFDPAESYYDEGYKPRLYIQSKSFETKNEAQDYINKIQDLLNNWDVIVEYNKEVVEIKNKYSVY